jgi:DNA-directed RNA polymerase specialized sigma24 family protein
MADESIGASPEHEAVRREERDLLLTAIQELPGKQRVPLTLRYYLGMDRDTARRGLPSP